MSDIQVVIVSKKSQQKPQSVKSEHEKTLLAFQTTNSLISQINFNSTVNRFEYLQQLLRQQHGKFVKNMTAAVNQQKEVLKQMKVLQKQLKEMKTPMINFNKINSQSQDLLKVKNESDKNLKLSIGMLNALSKMQQQIDNYTNSKNKVGESVTQQPIL